MRRSHVTETSLSKFLEAYKILCSEVYIPEKHKEGYIELLKKIGNIRDDAPTKIKLLQYKIGLDRYLGKLTREIYGKVKLGEFSSDT